MSELQKDFIQFVQWLLDDEESQTWLMSLSRLDGDERVLALRNKAIQLAQSNENGEIIKTVASLADDAVFDSVRAVLLAELNRN